MKERGSGEGAGYAVYGCYPEYRDCYALHVFFDNIHETKKPVDNLLEQWGRVIHEGRIQTYEQPHLRRVHAPWRYFFKPDPDLMSWSPSPEDDIVTGLVMRITSERKGALVISSGKNMGVFKASGWPEEVADFYGIDRATGTAASAAGRHGAATSNQRRQTSAHSRDAAAPLTRGSSVTRGRIARIDRRARSVTVFSARLAPIPAP